MAKHFQIKSFSNENRLNYYKMNHDPALALKERVKTVCKFVTIFLLVGLFFNLFSILFDFKQTTTSNKPSRKCNKIIIVSRYSNI